MGIDQLALLADCGTQERSMVNGVDILRRIYEGFDVGLFSRIPPTFGRTWSVHVDRLLACGDTVIMQGRYSGTARSTGVAPFTR